MMSCVAYEKAICLLARHVWLLFKNDNFRILKCDISDISSGSGRNLRVQLLHSDLVTLRFQDFLHLLIAFSSIYRL